MHSAFSLINNFGTALMKETNGHLETNIRVSLSQETRSQSSKKQFRTIHAWYQSHQLIAFYSWPYYYCHQTFLEIRNW